MTISSWRGPFTGETPKPKPIGVATPDMLIVSTFFADSLAAVQRVYDDFAGRNWRRIKRELRKAHRAVNLKHRGKHG